MATPVPDSGSLLGFFNEDFWRSLVGSLIGTGLMSATALAVYRYVFKRTLEARETIILFVAFTVFLSLGLLTLRSTIGAPVVVETDAGLNSTVSALKDSVQQLSQQQRQLFWQPLTRRQKELIASELAKVGKEQRILVLRPDTPDCEMLAEGFAAAAELAGWHLLEPPTSSQGLSGTGLFMFADEDVEHLKTTVSKELNTDVGLDPLNMAALMTPDGKPLDLAFYIGPKTSTSAGFLKEGNQTITKGALKTILDVTAQPPYEVSGWTTWGSRVLANETTPGHFEISFSTPAPPSGGTFHWEVYHYN